MRASCSGVASPASTIASTVPPGPRTTRPYDRGSSGTQESTVAAACSRRWVVDELLEQFGGQQRRVAGEHEEALRAVADGLASRADRVAGSEARSCTATCTSPNASRLSGEAITTSGAGSAVAPPRAPSPPSVGRGSGAGASARPSACACPAHRPSPPLRVVESVIASVTKTGAPGFEPGITGPKPVALPLGHAPWFGRRILPGGRAGGRRARRRPRARARRPRRRSGRTASAGTSTTADLRDREDPGELSHLLAVGLPAGGDVERDRDDRDEDDRPPRGSRRRGRGPPSTRATRSAIRRRFSRRARPKRLLAVLDRQRAIHDTTVPFIRTRREPSTRSSRRSSARAAPLLRGAGGGRARRRSGRPR